MPLIDKLVAGLKDGRAGTSGDCLSEEGVARSLKSLLALCRLCILMDGGAVGVAPMAVVGADVGLTGNIPWKLFIDLPFLRSISEDSGFSTRLLYSILTLVEGKLGL